MSERHSDLRVIRWTDTIKQSIYGDAAGPIRANLDLTNLCSHACPWCEPVDFRLATIADKSHTLSFDVARHVIEDLHVGFCKTVQFSGGGEPTLHPRFGELLTLAHMGMTTVVITHGGYLDKWADAIHQHADHVRVSLDASCEREHRQMHGSKEGEFDRIVASIRALTARESYYSYKSPEIGLAYNVADCNSSPESLHRFLKLATDLSVDYVQFRPVSEGTPGFLTHDWDVLADRISDLKVSFPWLRFEISGHRAGDVFTQREFDRCYAAVTLAVISANGDVCACCDERSIVFGNVNQDRFRHIWMSTKHRAIAKKIVPKLCSRCLMCGYNRGVQRFVVENEAHPEIL